ncbi:MAG: metallophosphoesterase [Candidatus Melainabacteria bacterium GWF2_32_7]|nr:MAG: metallophosphoesterase [Candidatus Melainabacteria bacterium GWF2_32_7]
MSTLDVLFLGDIVGKPGRRIVKNFLSEEIRSFERRPDFIIANAENASHGFGLTERNYNELLDIGIDALTSGNHIWDKKEIFTYIDKADKLVRPLNYPQGSPGVGSRVFNVQNSSIVIINVLGRVFMAPVDSPWSALENEIKRIRGEVRNPIIIIDFHAEATAEKISLGYFADNLGVSAVIGTHTHVQTSDEKILYNGAAYITDVGYCGAYHSIIGMEINNSIKRLITNIPERYDVAPIDKAELNAIKLSINIENGRTERIERIKYINEINEVS